MSQNIKIHENALYINDELVTFDFNIDTLIIMDTKIIVLLDIPYDSNELDNIYAVDFKGKIIWRVEKAAKKYPKLRHDPYVGISMLDEKLLARQFYGQRYIIDPDTGKLIERYTVGRDW
ncbi:hypothetical protein [uncultured Ruminococcus sp.]|uniref:hypothetical protein n=1 Tax=uncultured Ruminococcus sp. TaxID=165186 RepID=UPI0025CCCB19|nr:hypothetical protein [uncultured Ruminococcus sp.]